MPESIWTQTFKSWQECLSKNTELEQELRASRKAFGAERRARIVADRRLEGLAERVELLNKKLAERNVLVTSNIALMNERNHLRAVVVQLGKDIDHLEAMNEDLRRTIEPLQRAVAEAETARSRMTKRAADLERMVVNAMKGEDDLRATIDKQCRRENELIEQRDTLARLRKRLEATNANLKNMLANEVGQRQESAQGTNELLTRLKNQSTTIARLQSEVEGLTHALRKQKESAPQPPNPPEIRVTVTTECRTLSLNCKLHGSYVGHDYYRGDAATTTWPCVVRLYVPNTACQPKI